MPSHRFLNAASLLAVAILFTGCTTTRTTDTARTGMEQLLISNAVDQTLDKVALPAVAGRKVFVDDKYLEAVDKGYIMGSLRQRLMTAGALVVDAKDGSDMTLEIFSGGVGTDNVESYLGVPGLTVPGMPVEIPEVRVYEKKSQFGTAKLGLVAYATTTGEMLYDSGRTLARADDSRWSVMGVGPFQEGSVREEVNRSTGSTDFTARVANSVDDLKIR
ncbi:DUF6655 family protein [Mariniblastus fucicola]|uniref:Lipoprotein n=1 Tax=Mariniblastus fucicola TaxID=980251 RepID=A0A5B9PJ32_9BACT|nr:DUF6655 family protein [Mariniblastus fucicola]QEG22583.1 hypothetical protein MFFC18_24660 [Mariniblastus fucicola]